MMRAKFISLGVLFALAGRGALAGTYEAPRDVRKAGKVKFATEPRAVRAGNALKISFTSSAATDVEVAILDAGGQVVRHLAAGLLGRSAPAPFTKDALAQEVVWDMRDDVGKPAVGGPFKVRVRLGVKPRLDNILGRNDNLLSGGICALTVSPKGEIFVLLADAFRGRSEMRVLDSSGKYLRTIMPYAANTPPERTKPLGHLIIDGRRQPMVFNGQGHTVYPLVAGLRGQTMAWHPQGYLVAASSVGSMCNHGPPRFLIAFHPEGGAPEKISYIGPQIRKARGFMGGAGEGSSRGMDRIALSPDGQWIYLVQDIKRSWAFKKERQHGVFRIKWTDKTAGELWLGKKTPGAGDDEFNDPAGLAVDAKGRLFVCDRNNDRVKVYSPEGKLLGRFSAPKPEQIALHPKSGEIYLLCRPPARGYDIFKSKEPISSRLLKLAAWKEGQPKELAKLEFKNKKRLIERMALDASGPKPKLWATFYLGWRKSSGLVPITEEGGIFKLGDPVGKGAGLHFPSFLAADPERGRVFIYEHLNGRAYRGHKSIDIKSGKVTTLNTRGCDLAVDKHGNIYTMDHYNSKRMSRYDSKWKPLNFPGTGSNKLKIEYRAYGPCMGLRGHVIAPNGDIYVRRSPNHARISTVDVYGADGKIKKAGLVRGAGSGDSGIGVDNRGNVYLGMNLKPADKVLPADFAKQVPADAWRYYRRGKREPPWGYMYANPYVFHMGSVMKFGPEGGTIYGNFSTRSKSADKAKLAALAVDKAPAEATAYKSSYLRWDVKVVGAKWRYPGVGIIPHSFDGFRGDDGCECLQSQLDADLYGRVYAPSAFYSSVEMIDPAGNRIARIGAYGNADSAGPKSKVPEPEIAFAWPCETDYAEADGKLYVTDSVNRRVTVVKFEYAAEATCAAP